VLVARITCDALDEPLYDIAVAVDEGGRAEVVGGQLGGRLRPRAMKKTLPTAASFSRP